MHKFSKPLITSLVTLLILPFTAWAAGTASGDFNADGYVDKAFIGDNGQINVIYADYRGSIPELSTAFHVPSSRNADLRAADHTFDGVDDLTIHSEVLGATIVIPGGNTGLDLSSAELHKGHRPRGPLLNGGKIKISGESNF